MTRILLYCGLLCQLAMIGLLLLALFDINAALLLAEQAVDGNIAPVSRELSKAYTASLIGASLGGLGLLVYLLCAKKLDTPPPWVRKTGVIISLPHLILFPIGTVIGVVTIRYFRSLPQSPEGP